MTVKLFGISIIKSSEVTIKKVAGLRQFTLISALPVVQNLNI